MEISRSHGPFSMTISISVLMVTVLIARMTRKLSIRFQSRPLFASKRDTFVDEGVSSLSA
jgi:hypothetical protein